MHHGHNATADAVPVSVAYMFFHCARQAIEGFAVTVKDIAQMLQSFGTELAEPELPDEGKAIERLLQAHTEKYKKLKVSSYMCSDIYVTHIVTVSRKIRQLLFLSTYFDYIYLFFFLFFL